MSKICDDLRASILQAAMQGKLTERKNSDDDPELIKKSIIQERSKYKPCKYVNNGQEDITIPEEWCSLKTGEVYELLAGEKEDNNEKLPLLDAKYFRGKQRILTNKGKRANTNDILILVDGENSGETFNCAEPGYMGSTFKKLFIPKCLDKQFALYFLEMNRKILRDNKRGAAIPHLDKTVFFNFVFPIPPLAEQKRIVAKVDELMARVADLEKSADALAMLKSHYPDEMRAALLQAAMQGKLTERLPSDGSADELLRQIQAEKEQLIASGKIKKPKSALAPPTEKEIPFPIPSTWKWVRIGDITYNHGQKTPDKRFSYIDVGTLNNITLKLNENEQIIEPSKASSRARKIIHKGDVIYATIRPYLHNICIIDRDFSEEPIASTAFAVMSPYNGIYNKYLFVALLSPDFDSYANRSDLSKGVAYPAISEKDFFNGIIPLPPLAEQKRIVDRLDEAMKNIDTVATLIISE